MRLPTWEECSKKIEPGAALTPLEDFIYFEEPPDYRRIEWRTRLVWLLEWYAAQPKPVDPEPVENHSQRR